VHGPSRVKTFQQDARSAFGSLLDRGFQVSTEPPNGMTRRPATLALRFVDAETQVENTLVLGFAGEDAVHTILMTTQGSSLFGPSVAHKGARDAQSTKRRCRPGPRHH
jgi:hypothetical protein